MHKRKSVYNNGTLTLNNISFFFRLAFIGIPVDLPECILYYAWNVEYIHLVFVLGHRTWYCIIFYSVTSNKGRYLKYVIQRIMCVGSAPHFTTNTSYFNTIIISQRHLYTISYHRTITDKFFSIQKLFKYVKYLRRCLDFSTVNICYRLPGNKFNQ